MSTRRPRTRRNRSKKVSSCKIGAEIEAGIGHRRDGNAEVVAADVAAVGQEVPLADERRVADLGIERLRLNPEVNRLARARVRVRQQEIRRVAVEKGREHLRPQVAHRR